VKIQVTATSFAVWLKPLMCCNCEKTVAKNSICVIATLSQCDCTPYRSVINKKTVAKTTCDCDCIKKQLQKIGKKVRLQKTSSKKLHAMTLSDCD
jgi:hypothetical protein